MRTESDPKGYYHLLELPIDSTVDEIRAAFRRAAKRYHPDQGGPEADEFRFQAIREAYDVLKDPTRRLAYDADELADRRSASSTANSSTSRGNRFAAMPVVLTGLVVGVAAVIGMVVFLGQAVFERDSKIATLEAELGRSVSEQATMAMRLRAQNFSDLDQALEDQAAAHSVFHIDIDFPEAEIALTPVMSDQLNDELLKMTQYIQQIPPGRDWVVAVKSFAPRAADHRGVDVGPWETGLLRLAGVVEHVIALGLPHDRISAGFEAGFASDDVHAGGINRLELKLLCCLR